MKKVEILAPAGSFEALKAAVQNGADAVYLGGSMFGARAFANNFDEQEMKEAIAYAHVYGVNVYVTMNTLLKEDEVKDAVAYAGYLYSIDVDAIIVQDMGLFSILRSMFPDLELHCSTQMHIHNKEGINFMKECGAGRVVVPRETSVEEIKEFSKLGIDLEVFVQGAICVSYSGQCLMSSRLFERSGNRGACAQPCRMQYSLWKEEGNTCSQVQTKGNYLLSPKDLNTIDKVPQLIEAGIASFKIEGRMKRPEYVALMVREYRKAVDAYYENKKVKINEETKKEMSKIFNRGFTAGHLFHQMGSQLMNPYRPNHIGIEIGKVVWANKNKMRIELKEDLLQGDGIRILNKKEDEGFIVNRIYNRDGLLVNKGKANETIELDNKGYVENGSIVVKTSDVKQLEALSATFDGIKRRVKIDGMFTLMCNEKAVLTVWDQDGNTARIESEMNAEKAMNKPLLEERIMAQLMKTKDTPFEFDMLECMTDGESILPISQLNAMRRNVLAQLETMRKKKHQRSAAKNYQIKVMPVNKLDSLIVSVHTRDQYQACMDAGIKTVYIANEELYHGLKQIDPNVQLRSDRVQKEQYPNNPVLAQENGAMAKGIANIYDTGLNISNSYAAAFLNAQNASGICVSLELNIDEIKDMYMAYKKRYGYDPNIIVPIYVQEELMLSEYCVINACEKDNNKKQCALCKGKTNYYLMDMKQRKFPVQGDSKCRMHLYNEHVRNDIDLIEDYKQIGIQHFLCVFTKENKEECQTIIKELINKLEA